MKPHICKCTGEIYAEVAGQIRKRAPALGLGEGGLRERGYIYVYIYIFVCMYSYD